MVNRCERRIVAESWREAVRKGRRGGGLVEVGGVLGNQTGGSVFEEELCSSLTRAG